MRFQTCLAMTASAFTLLTASPGSTMTLTDPAYSVAALGTVPDTSNGFGNMAFGADGTGYIIGGYGLSRGDIYSLSVEGSYAKLTTLGNTGLGVAVQGNFVYATTELRTVTRTDTATGATITLVGLSADNGAPNGLEIIDGLNGASFTLVVVQYDGTATFLNGDTGAVQAKYNLGIGSGVANVEQGPDGTLYAVNYNGTTMAGFTASGVISTVTIGSGFDALAIHGGTGAFYGYTSNLGGAIYTLDPFSGGKSLFASGVSGDGGYYPGLLEFSNDGTKLYVGERSGGLAISVISGFSAIDSVSAAEVPLPAGLGLLLGALGGLRLLRRRKG